MPILIAVGTHPAWQVSSKFCLCMGGRGTDYGQKSVSNMALPFDSTNARALALFDTTLPWISTPERRIDFHLTALMMDVFS